MGCGYCFLEDEVLMKAWQVFIHSERETNVFLYMYS